MMKSIADDGAQTRHLALAASSVYFMPTQKTVPAILSEFRPRLVIVYAAPSLARPLPS
jgi:hypothetical protein